MFWNIPIGLAGEISCNGSAPRPSPQEENRCQSQSQPMVPVGGRFMERGNPQADWQAMMQWSYIRHKSPVPG
jgi:hypothetical protein